MSENKKILLIDDEINVCTGCKRILEEEGYELDYELTGKDGIEKALKQTYDVIITDLKMPDINGVELIKEVKKKKPDVPIIMITGYASVPTAIETMKLGVVDYIPKPFKPEELVASVQKAVGGSVKK